MGKPKRRIYEEIRVLVEQIARPGEPAMSGKYKKETGNKSSGLFRSMVSNAGFLWQVILDN